MKFYNFFSNKIKKKKKKNNKRQMRDKIKNGEC